MIEKAADTKQKCQQPFSMLIAKNKLAYQAVSQEIFGPLPTGHVCENLLEVFRKILRGGASHKALPVATV